MVRYWIFVLLPYSDFNRGNVDEIIKKAKISGKWPIGKRTVRKFQLSKGDKILMYLAGDEGKKFVGSGELLSSLQQNDKDSEEFVTLGNLRLWKNQPIISDLLDKLTFIKKKSHYGLYLKGGVISISESDFKLVLKKAGLQKKIEK